MDAGDRDELLALRARAYGPTADIHEDPAALRRLQELESGPADLSPSPHTEPDDSELVSAPEEPAPQGSEAAPDGDRSAAAEDESAPTGADPVDPPSPVLRRRWIVVGALWVLSLIVAAGITWAVTVATASVPPGTASGAEQRVATLESSSLRALPKEWFGSSSNSLAFDFYGLTVFTTDSGLGTGTNCFMVVPTSEVPDQKASVDAWSRVEILLTGCKAGGFPATAQATVNETYPQELRTRFPAGSALKFVLDDDRIDVYSSPG